MDNNYENIIPWNGANDTGKDVRLKLERNFAKIGLNFSEIIGKLADADDLFALISEELEKKLDRSVFDGAFRFHYKEDSSLESIESIVDLWTEKSISAKGKANGSASGDGSVSSLGQLNNVGSWADDIPTADRIIYQVAGSTHWASKNLSDIVGLDTEALHAYLYDHSYATQNWVTNQGYATQSALNTVSSKVDNFLEGSDTDGIINKWKELEAFLSGQTQSSTLADLLSVKADKSTVDTMQAAINNKLDTAYFKRVFGVLDVNDNELAGNDMTTVIDSLKLKVGTWTEEYFSIKGQNPGTGGSVSLALSQLADVSLASLGNGESLVYSSSLGKWINGVAGLSKVTVKIGTVSYDSVDGTVSLPSYPTSLPAIDVYSWAKQPNKPGYVWNEIGDRPSAFTPSAHTHTFASITSKPITLSGYGITDALPLTGGTLTGNLNINGVYIGSGNEIWCANSDLHIQYAGRSSYGIRLCENNGPLTYGSPNYTIWHSGNDSDITKRTATYTGNLNEDIVSGFYTCGDEAINKPSTYGGHLYAINAGNYTSQLFHNLSGNRFYSRVRFNGTFGTWGTLAYLTDNVASATQLQTARSIWGQSFDGTGNVDGTLSIRPANGNYSEGIRIHKAPSNWGVLIFCGSDNTGDVSTSANTWGIFNSDTNDFYINRNGSYHHTGYELCNVGGNWGIGTNSPGYKLDVNGGIHTSEWFRSTGTQGWYNETYGGGIYMTDTTYVRVYNGKSFYVPNEIYAAVGIWTDGYLSGKGQNTTSDMRLKTVIRHITLKTDDIANAPSFVFNWKDGNNGKDIGSSAQYWQKVLPESVCTGKSGFLEFKYANTALLASISNAKKILNHEERIKELENENMQLKQTISNLERRLSA